MSPLGRCSSKRHSIGNIKHTFKFYIQSEFLIYYTGGPEYSDGSKKLDFCQKESFFKNCNC